MNSILFLSVMNGGAWGGSEELWYQSALWTARQGYSTAVCCFDWEDKKNRIKKLQDTGCTVFLMPGKEITKKQGLLGRVRLKTVISKIPFEEYDLVIVSQGGWKDVAYGPFKKLYERLKKYVLLYHNYNDHARFSSSRSASMQAWVNNASINLGDTEKIFDALSSVYKIKNIRQEKLFNPLTFDPPDDAPIYPVLSNSNYIFSVFAALDIERKAQDVLIKALADENWRFRNWQLRLYGEGKDKNMLLKLIREFKMEEKIFLCGKAADYKEAISETHLVLQITHIDAMPITVMDSLAMAKPLVVSSVGDMPSWVQPDRNGWITNAVTVDAVNKTLQVAWENKDRWKSMGQESFRLFKANFPDKPIVHFLHQVNFLP